jgi:hypothetical protein
MKRALYGLGLALSATLAAGAGCATDDGSECQPGDIDCSDEAGDGGKADGWNYLNDPARLANALQYRLTELPRNGKLDKPVWKDRFPSAPSTMNPIWSETYFPSARGSTNTRWQGSSVKSPLEKYDAAFNNAPGAATQPSVRCGSTAKSQWDTYLAAAGPAAKWASQNFQGMVNGYNGRDDDGNGQTDECSGGQNGYGPDNTPAGWWGLCHAWTPASILEPEAIHSVTYNGVTFDRSDIHALLMTIYDKNEALMLGGRCNATTFNPDNRTSANDSCFDSNPGAMHVVLTNFLGLADQAIAFDRTANTEVWNQPIYSYDVQTQHEVSKTAANECVGSSGSSWTYNTAAKKLYEVKMDVSYVVEGNPSKDVLAMEDYLSTDSFHYILELDDGGKVIGGRWCTDSFDEHPDFMWAPLRPSTSSSGRNPNVSLEKVRQLLKLSVDGDGGGGGGSGQEFTGQGGAIPDDDANGMTSTITVSGVSGSGGGSVSVDITHTYRGDLRVTLEKDGREIKVLHDNAGGSEDNLVETYTLSASELGTDRNGTYTLRIVDSAAQDEGRLNSWKLIF